MTTSERLVASRSTAPKRVRWRLVIVASALSVATIAIIWFAAVPWGPIVCPAIYPMPRSCIPAYRTGVALLATIAVVLVCAATIGAVAAGWRRAAAVGTGLLVAAPAVTYLAVAFIPGPAIVATSAESLDSPTESRAYRDIPEFGEPQTTDDHPRAGLVQVGEPREPFDDPARRYERQLRHFRRADRKLGRRLIQSRADSGRHRGGFRLRGPERAKLRSGGRCGASTRTSPSSSEILRTST
ncbi:hypothetical protein [Microbacterium sp. LWS13-1.2]|uniref:Uncharacterized protein n=1 Tax=Microbacterium sp. LWS13-1.2 TaxID=3135264 RepID=A0AAU6S8N5_9MICO